MLERPARPILEGMSPSRLLGAALVAAAWLAATPAPAQSTLESANVADLQQAMDRGSLSSEQLTRAYLARVAAYDKQGPAVNAIITVNPAAMADARRLDSARRARKARGPLYGVPIVLKDNLDTADMPTSAGSYLLRTSRPAKDAVVVKRLRAAGALIIAKANMDEFAANGGAPNGFSSLGRQTRNPHDPARSPGGSSGGVAAAVAASFAQAGVGTDTSLSVRGPAAYNGVVGLRPTTGLISLGGVVPLSSSFDTPGPIARNVYDAAALLDVLADPASEAPNGKPKRPIGSYVSFLKPGALHGARIGVVRSPSLNADTARVFEATVGRLRELGATIVDPAELPGFLLAAKSELYATVRTTEFTAEIDRYLAGLGPGEPQTLSELVARAEAPGSGYDNPPKLKSLRQSLSAPPITDPVYLAARRDGLKMMRSGMAAVFERYGVEALVYPSTPKPAGDVEALPDKLSSSLLDLAAVSGLPDLTIPAGMSREGLPIGVSFLGRPFSEPRLLAFGYDLEQATHARVDPRTTPALSSDKLAAARRH